MTFTGAGYVCDLCAARVADLTKPCVKCKAENTRYIWASNPENLYEERQGIVVAGKVRTQDGWAHATLGVFRDALDADLYVKRMLGEGKIKDIFYLRARRRWVEQFPTRTLEQLHEEAEKIKASGDREAYYYRDGDYEDE